MAKSSELIDDDGNVIPRPPPDSPVVQIVWLLEYARKRRFQIGQVTVGDTTVLVNDIDQAEQVAARRQRQPDIAPGSDMALVLGDE